jgi:hypothetical protein
MPIDAKYLIKPVTLSVSCPALSCSFDSTNISTGGSATLTVFTGVITLPDSYAMVLSG